MYSSLSVWNTTENSYKYLLNVHQLPTRHEIRHIYAKSGLNSDSNMPKLNKANFRFPILTKNGNQYLFLQTTVAMVC